MLSVDGHDVGAVLDVLDEAAANKGAPTVIVAETIKGKGVSFAENTSAFHNAALTQEQYDQALFEIEESGRMLAMTSPNLRSAYGASLVRLGKKDGRVVALEADLGKSTQSVDVPGGVS